MEKQKKKLSTKFRVVIGCILTVMLFASPCSALVVLSGQTLDIGTGKAVEQVNEALIVMGTANLYPGAYVSQTIYAFNGCTINFYGGQLGAGRYTIIFGSSPVITVHGTNFAVAVGDGEPCPCDPAATSFTLVSGQYNTLTGFYGNGDLINLTFLGQVPINLVVVETKIDIDVKPGSEENIINLKSRGVVPVAALTTDDFDAAEIDAGTVKFAGATPVHWKLADVDEDGDIDMMFHFRTQQLELEQNSTEATLTAQLTALMTTRSIEQASSGTTVSGTDKVRVISSKK